jgi:hypothetical protein
MFDADTVYAARTSPRMASFLNIWPSYVVRWCTVSAGAKIRSKSDERNPHLRRTGVFLLRLPEDFDNLETSRTNAETIRTIPPVKRNDRS